MTFYKFHEDDLFVNTLEMYPEYSFYIQSGSVYVDSVQNISGANTDNILCIPDGYVSLYEYNIDRASDYIYPFLIKSGNRDGFKSLSSAQFNSQYNTLDSRIITSSYRMSASLARDYYGSSYTGTARTYVQALKNKFKQYTYLSPHYQYSSSFGDKSEQKINVISIPSILFGSSIKKGSLSLKYYITGSLIGQLTDSNRNGELIQTSGTISANDGEVAGVVLYNEGIIVLTGSWSLDSHLIQYDSTDNSKWVDFGFGIKPSSGSVSIYGTDAHGRTHFLRRSTVPDPTINNTTLSASFLLEYKGTTHTQVMTMMANAPYGELNHSNNPTFITSSDINQVITGSYQYTEEPKTIKNVVHSQFTDEVPEFEKVTYISKVGLYDKDRNLIGVAKVATPVRKTENLSYTFKLKLDI